jgi:hypothetical protein
MHVRVCVCEVRVDGVLVSACTREGDIVCRESVCVQSACVFGVRVRESGSASRLVWVCWHVCTCMCMCCDHSGEHAPPDCCRVGGRAGSLTCECLRVCSCMRTRLLRSVRVRVPLCCSCLLHSLPSVHSPARTSLLSPTGVTLDHNRLSMRSGPL